MKVANKNKKLPKIKRKRPKSSIPILGKYTTQPMIKHVLPSINMLVTLSSAIIYWFDISTELVNVL